MKENQKKQTIKNRIFWPIIVMVSIQLVFLLCMFLFGGLMQNIESQSIENLSDKTENQERYIENKMIKEWGNLEDYNNQITKSIETILEQNRLDIRQIKTNADLNNQIIEENSETIIQMLRGTDATGAFIILNGKANESDQSEKDMPGLYIRNLQPDTTAKDNADLQIQIALPNVCKNMNIPLSSFWQSMYHFNSGLFSDESFYYVPYEDAVEHPGKGILDYGYWSTLYEVDSSGTRQISYTIPIIVDEQVVGVMGIDVTEEQLQNALRINANTRATNICYILGKSEKDSGTFDVIQSCGSLFTYNFGDAKSIHFKENKKGLYEFTSRKENDKAMTYMMKLAVYSNNSSQKDTGWYMTACENESTLMEYSNHIRIFLVVLIIFTLAVMLFCISVASNRIAAPIRHLVEEVSGFDASKEFNVKATGILEVDELLTAFSRVREMTAEYTKNMSDMIAITNLPVGIFEYNLEMHVVFCSESLFHVLEWEEESRKDNNVMASDLFVKKLALVRENIYDKEQNIYVIKDSRGRDKWIKLHTEQDKDRMIGAVLDVSDEVIEKQKIAYERDYDLLTGMLNRRAFLSKMLELKQGQDDLKTGAMIMVDSDNLKYVNDTYGHEAGDSYLQKIAECFKEFEKYNGMCGRRSGDEFYVFIHGYDTKEEIKNIIGVIWEKLNTTALMLPDNSQLLLRCSAGIAWYPADNEDLEMLIRYADFAMYQVKHSSKGTFVEFDLEQFKSESMLLYGHKALSKLLDEKLLDYAMQPILDVHTGSIYGYEMLMRTSLTEFASPFDILKMAKSQSKLFQLEYVSWFRALQTFDAKRRAGAVDEDCKVFINSIGSVYLSEEQTQLMEERFAPFMNNIVLELTEEESSSEEIIDRKLSFIKRLGGMVAIDDYGSGYNNMTSLFIARPDIIKIDMSIVRDIHRDPERRLIFSQAVNLAKMNDAKIVAEGVETREEMICVMGLGADLIQGYYVGKPSFKIETINEEAVNLVKTLIGQGTCEQ